jgi:hypothetical protein
MPQSIRSGSSFDSLIPALTDNADIVKALKDYHYGTITHPTNQSQENDLTTGIVGLFNSKIGAASPTFTGTVSIDGQNTRYQYNLLLNESTWTQASPSLSSNRAGILFGEVAGSWTMGQDSEGNGTRDFFIFGGASGTPLEPTLRFHIAVDGSVSIPNNSLNVGTGTTSGAYRIQASAPNAGMGLVSTSSTGGSWIDFVNGSTVRSNIHYNYGTEVLSFGTTTPGIGGTRVDRMGIGNFGISVSGNVQYNLQTLETGTATLTAADILTRNIYVSSGTFSLTLDTGTNFDSALTAPSIGTTIEWVVMNDGTGTITVQSGTGHTLRGSGTVSATSAARFITRKTGTNFYVTYRL